MEKELLLGTEGAGLLWAALSGRTDPYADSSTGDGSSTLTDDGILLNSGSNRPANQGSIGGSPLAPFGELTILDMNLTMLSYDTDPMGAFFLTLGITETHSFVFSVSSSGVNIYYSDGGTQIVNVSPLLAIDEKHNIKAYVRRSSLTCDVMVDGTNIVRNARYGYVGIPVFGFWNMQYATSIVGNRECVVGHVRIMGK